MSGTATESSEPGSHGSSAPANSWSDTVDLGLPPQPADTPAVGPSDNAADQLPTIGHIGRYALKYQIGEGGLGRVYAAHDPLLSRLIAIKTLNLEIAAEERESFNALFLNEARAAGGLSHPHIVTVFDAGVSEQGAYIAMEMLKGRDLRQLRLEGWKPTPTQAALIVRRVSDALAYAHSKGVVHRDIKPANIFMVGRTQPRVLDFGIARIAHQHDHHEDDIAGGSPYYMAPEQVRQQPVDRRGDVFSLGVVLYELLTGVRPFRGSSFKEITDAVVGHEPPRAHEVDASVPEALSAIAARAMEKNPEERYRSARALARELRHWLEEHAQEVAESTEESPSPSKRPLVLAMGVGAALVLAGTVWWGMHPQTGANGSAVARPPPAQPQAEAAAAPPSPASAALAAAAAATADSTASAALVTAAGPAASGLLMLDPVRPSPIEDTVAATPAPSPMLATAPGAAVPKPSSTSAATPSAAAAPAQALAPAQLSPSATAHASPPAPVLPPAPAPTVVVGPPAMRVQMPAPSPAPVSAEKDLPTVRAPSRPFYGSVPGYVPPPAPAAAASVATASPDRPAAPPKETQRDRRAREAREAREREIARATPAVVQTGVLRVAISPWGQIEVDGRAAGTSPPLSEITLPEGRHTITIRNDEFTPYTATVTIVPGQPYTLKYRFGS